MVMGETDLISAPLPPATITVGARVIVVLPLVIVVPSRVVVLALESVCEMVCTKLVGSRLGVEGDWVLMTVLGEGGVLPDVTVRPGPVVVAVVGLAVVEGGWEVAGFWVLVTEGGLTGVLEGDGPTGVIEETGWGEETGCGVLMGMEGPDSGPPDTTIALETAARFASALPLPPPGCRGC